MKKNSSSTQKHVSSPLSRFPLPVAVYPFHLSIVIVVVDVVVTVDVVVVVNGTVVPGEGTFGRGAEGQRVGVGAWIMKNGQIISCPHHETVIVIQK